MAGGAARPRPAGGPLQLLPPARRAARRRPTCCWSTPAATCTTSRPPPPASPGHRHHRVQAARRPAEGVPLAGRRPVRRRRRHASVSASPSKALVARCSPAPWPPPGRLHAPQRPRLALPHPDWVAPAGRGGEVDVAQGALAGQRRLRGVLRQAQGRVLPREDWRGVSAEQFAAELAEGSMVPGGEAEGVRRGRAQGVMIAGRRRRLGLALGRPGVRTPELLVIMSNYYIALIRERIPNHSQWTSITSISQCPSSQG